MKQDAVVALGNPLMGDEGAGPAVLERLRVDLDLGERVDLIDSAGSSMTALHALSGRRKVVFVDCGYMGEEPGTLKRFLPRQAVSEKNMPRLSLHEGDLMQVLEMAELLGDGAREVVVFGIEPERLGPGAGLSARLRSRLDEYARRIRAEFMEQAAPAR